MLYGEEVKLSDIAATFDTPCYIYSRACLEKQLLSFQEALGDLPHRICYAVKANSNIAILNLLAKKNSGFDIVSQGELERVLAAKGDPKKIVFSGVGKLQGEIERALEVGIGCFNVESEAELTRLAEIAKRLNKTAPIALRVNPDIDPKTHPHVATGLSSSKFGIEYDAVVPLCQKMHVFSHVKLIGLACHIGSQLTELEPFLEALDKLFALKSTLEKMQIVLQHINIGGGLGVRYRDEDPPSIQAYVAALRKKMSQQKVEFFFEPGRVLVAKAGILLTKVEYIKQSHHKNFAIVDAGMNDFIRPSLYNAWHEIIPVHLRENEKQPYDIVGPVCESADYFGKNRNLSLQPGDLLTILGVGAYGFVMSSNYNSRPRVAEILIDKDKMHLIRERESFETLFEKEYLI